jgi:hypothetical protein
MIISLLISQTARGDTFPETSTPLVNPSLSTDFDLEDYKCHLKWRDPWTPPSEVVCFCFQHNLGSGDQYRPGAILNDQQKIVWAIRKVELGPYCEAGHFSSSLLSICLVIYKNKCRSVIHLVYQYRNAGFPAVSSNALFLLWLGVRSFSHPMTIFSKI